MSDSDDQNDPADRDAKLKERVLEIGRGLVDLHTGSRDDVARLVDRINAVTARAVPESVLRAAAHVSMKLSESLKYLTWKCRHLADARAAVERAARMLDVTTEATTIVDAVKYDQLERADESVADLTAAVDAIEFAANAGQNDATQRVSDAMGRILGGVTELRSMGFEVGEIQSTVDDFINLRTQYEFALLAPVISENDAKGTKRNKRSEERQRERLLAEDQWVLRFLNEFWCRYWRNTFERALPVEEHETNIKCALAVMPQILDEQAEPMDARYLCIETWSRIRKLRRESDDATSSRIRVRDDHVLAALERLLRSADSDALDVVEIDGETPRYWTRHRAVAALLKIAPRSDSR